MIRNFSHTLNDNFYHDYKQGVISRGSVLSFTKDGVKTHYKIVFVVPKLRWCLAREITMYNDDLEEV